MNIFYNQQTGQYTDQYGRPLTPQQIAALQQAQQPAMQQPNMYQQPRPTYQQLNQGYQQPMQQGFNQQPYAFQQPNMYQQPRPQVRPMPNMNIPSISQGFQQPTQQQTPNTTNTFGGGWDTSFINKPQPTTSQPQQATTTQEVKAKPAPGHELPPLYDEETQILKKIIKGNLFEYIIENKN